MRLGSPNWAALCAACEGTTRQKRVQLRARLDELVDDGQREGERLARAGASAPDKVAPLAHGAEGGALNREELLDTAGLERLGGGRAELEVRHLGEADRSALTADGATRRVDGARG